MSARPAQLTRERNGNWRGGRVVDPRGYVLIRVGVGHPLADVRGYAYEHRLIAAKNASVIGKQVHHEDGVLAVATCLSKLKRAGKVTNIGGGKWCLRG